MMCATHAIRQDTRASEPPRASRAADPDADDAHPEQRGSHAEESCVWAEGASSPGLPSVTLDREERCRFLVAAHRKAEHGALEDVPPHVKAHRDPEPAREHRARRQEEAASE